MSKKSLVVTMTFFLCSIILLYLLSFSQHNRGFDDAIKIKSFEFWLASNMPLLFNIDELNMKVEKKVGLLVVSEVKNYHRCLANIYIYPGKDKVYLEYLNYSNKYIIKKNEIIPMFECIDIPQEAGVYKLVEVTDRE